VPGLYFEEFIVGQRFEHLVRRTVTETDNLLFSALTMNPAALHLDAEYARTTPFGERRTTKGAIAVPVTRRGGDSRSHEVV